MSRCLSDDELVLAFYGDLDDDGREHLRSCLGCTARHRRLADDMHAIGAALRQPPAGHEPARGRRRRVGVAVAAGLVALVLVAATEVWMWRALRPLTEPIEQVDAETAAFLDRVSAMLSSAEEPGAPELISTETTDADRATDAPENRE